MVNKNPSISARDTEAFPLDKTLSSVLDGVDYGVLLTDLDHVSLLCNRRFGDLFGLDPEASVRQDPAALRRQVQRRIVDFEAWSADLDEVYADPYLVREDELILQSPHQVMRRHTSPVRGEDGRVVGRVWTFLDITQHHRRRAQLRIIRQVAQLFDEDPAAVCQQIANLVSKHYGSIALVSILERDYLRFQTVSGAPEMENPPEGNPVRLSFCQFCLEVAGPVVIQDARQETPYSEFLPVQLGLTRYAGVPIFRSDGAPLGTFCVLDQHSDQEFFPDDLSFLGVLAQRVGAEVERAERLSRLEFKLGSKQEELSLAQQQLVQSEQLAITGTLSASIGHDIRNIIAAAQLQFDLVEDVPAGFAESVRGTLSRLEVMAHRLMSYARPNRLTQQYTGLPEVIEGVVELLRHQFEVSGVELVFDHSLGDQLLMADEGRLEHLFVNLLVNALSATPAGGKVRILAENQGADIWVTVSDNGSGIRDELLPNIFSPFVTTKPDGFGLGLYSCRCIVEDHGGQISVTSGTEGTSFRIRLPRAK